MQVLLVHISIDATLFGIIVSLQWPPSFAHHFIKIVDIDVIVVIIIVVVIIVVVVIVVVVVVVVIVAVVVVTWYWLGWRLKNPLRI